VRPLTLLPVTGMPEVQEGDDLASLNLYVILTCGPFFHIS
jgi:hypothetical protein